MLLYGSVIQRPDGQFQLWYSFYLPEGGGMVLGYLESDDGINWRRPLLDVFRWKGKKTNIVFTDYPHGATVMYDVQERREERRYKMLCGAAPSHQISAYCSPDGIHWKAAGENPVIPSNPDSPMSLTREEDGRYVAYHRIAFADRRVGRSESWDFKHWSPPQLILEPGPGDTAQIQFYGMGSTPYGTYHLGTLWGYHTKPGDRPDAMTHGNEDAELAYCRSETAWHRAERGTVFIPRGGGGVQNLQCASSAVLCKDEIRFYYSEINRAHGYSWDGPAVDCALGMAVAKPDRFVGLVAKDKQTEIVSRTFWIRTPEIFINADIKRDGFVKLELLDHEWNPISGFVSQTLSGNDVALPVEWPAAADFSRIVKTTIRFRLRAKNATVFSVWMKDGDDEPIYHSFRSPGFWSPEIEMREAGVR